MNRVLPGLLILVVLSGVAHAAPKLSGHPDELESYLLEKRKLVVLSAEGLVTVEADTAVIRLSVLTKESKFRSALNKNRRVRDVVARTLVDAGVDQSNISFSKYSSLPRMGLFGKKPSSYEVRNEVKVAIKNEDQMLAVADIVDGFDEVRIASTELEHQGQEQAENDAVRKAAQIVFAKKALYEKELGIQLVPVRVVEHHIAENSAVIFDAPEKFDLSPSAGLSVSTAERFAPVSHKGSFGEMVYRAKVSVEYVVK